MLDKLKKLWAEGFTVEVKPAELTEKAADGVKAATKHYIKTEQVSADAKAVGDKSKKAIEDIKAKIEARKQAKAEAKALAAANEAISSSEEPILAYGTNDAANPYVPEADES